MAFPYSSAVVAGTNATATEHNNTRKDGLTRFLKFEIVGTLVVANKQGGSFIAPFNGSVVQIYHKTTSGTASFRIKSASNVVDSAISSSSTYATETVIALPTVTKGELVTLDITTASGVDLVAMVEILPTP